jgi:O-antigen/teichoic acid export membrane protein
MSERFTFPRAELRRRTVRGAVITGGFLVLIDGLVLVQGLIVVRLLGPRAIGLYGVVSTAVISLIALKRIGIDELFVQQNEPDQQREFQYAFTLELGLSAAMSLIIVAAAPIVALLYRDHRLLVLMVSLAYLPLAFALQAPLWVFFRRMDYRRQRSLQAIQPAVSFAVTVPLAAATGLGVWSLIVGQAAGYGAAVAAGLIASPYGLRIRFDRAVTARYLRFSSPILVTVVGTMLIAQGQILAIKLHDGLAAAGFITLAVGLTRYIDRADQIVTATIYPAICAIQGERPALRELYLKSNRATLMWVLPYAAGLVLFAPDLARFVLGPSWLGAVILLQGLAIVGALTQLGFNWFSFYRAHGDPRPQAVEAVVGTAAFLVLAVGGLVVDGFHGFVVGRIAAALVTLAVRRVYIRRLLPGVRYWDLLAPTVLPAALATAAVLALRFALWGGRRHLGQAVLELLLFGAIYTVMAMRRERDLVTELFGALRRRPPAQENAPDAPVFQPQERSFEDVVADRRYRDRDAERPDQHDDERPFVPEEPEIQRHREVPQEDAVRDQPDPGHDRLGQDSTRSTR